MRMIIDGLVVTEPRAWRVSKVNRVSPNGILLTTLAQDAFDQHKDYIELNEDGNVIGMWADYYSYIEKPVDYKSEVITNMRIELSHSGTKAEIRNGGTAKTITAKLFDNDKEKKITISGLWSYLIGEEDVSDLITQTDISDGVVKIKFDGDLSYIGKMLTIKYRYGDVVGILNMEIKR